MPPDPIDGAPSLPPVLDGEFADYWALSGDHAAMLDEQGRFVDLNPAYRAAAGHPISELVGQKALGFFHPDDKPALRRAWDEVRRTGTRSTLSARWHGASDTWRAWDVELIARPSGGVLLIGRDAMDRRRREEIFRRLQRFEILGRLTGSVVHDFNNLLTAIHGHSELLSQSLEESDPRRADALGLKAVADRAAALTTQLLAFNRRGTVHPKPVQIGDSLVVLEKTLHRLMGEDVDIRVLTADRLPYVRLDPGWIEQIVLGAALLARESLPYGGRVLVAGDDVQDESGGRRVRIQVTAVPKPDGEGGAYRGVAGLLDREALAEIVHLSGGRWRATEDGAAAPHFTVDWPAWSEARSRVAEAAAAYRGGETILLVEDDGTVRELARRVLTENGHRVIEAGSAEEALAAVSSGEDVVDLLLSDIVLPGESGLDLAVTLRKRWPSLKVLLMSGSLEAHGRPADFVDDKMFFPKPFRPKELARKVREVLDEAAVGEST